MSNSPYIDTLIGMGINPKNGLPVKMGSNKCELKQSIKTQLRIIDEQDAANRYIWKNIPAGLTSQELERLIYYKGQLCFFYDKNVNKYYFMPYALDGTIDFYGRYNMVHPLPFMVSAENKQQQAYLSSLKLNCVYSKDDFDASKDNCVLIHDYTKQMSQSTIARAQLNDGLLDVMSDVIPFMRTNLIASTGIKSVRVHDADQADSVHQANESVERAALTGNQFVPLVGNAEFQELTNGTVTKSEEFMLAMQSLDNFRLSTYGIENGGLFQKKAHELQSEAEINNSNTNLVYKDGLEIRKNFCEIANAVFGLNMSCEEMEMEVEEDVQYEDNDTDME